MEIIQLVEGLPKTKTADIIGRQLLRSATSVAANYRSACRAKSRADFISKMGIVEEEADESLFWLELLVETYIANNDKALHLSQEFNEIIAITVSSIKTARQNKA